MAALNVLSPLYALTCAGLWALTQSRFWAWATSVFAIITLVAAVGGIV